MAARTDGRRFLNKNQFLQVIYKRTVSKNWEIKSAGTCNRTLYYCCLRESKCLEKNYKTTHLKNITKICVLNWNIVYSSWEKLKISIYISHLAFFLLLTFFILTLMQYCQYVNKDCFLRLNGLENTVLLSEIWTGACYIYSKNYVNQKTPSRWKFYGILRNGLKIICHPLKSPDILLKSLDILLKSSDIL